jgi:hypothetical protein
LGKLSFPKSKQAHDWACGLSLYIRPKKKPMKNGSVVTASNIPYRILWISLVGKTEDECSWYVSEHSHLGNTRRIHTECPCPVGPKNGFLGTTTRWYGWNMQDSYPNITVEIYGDPIHNPWEGARRSLSRIDWDNLIILSHKIRDKKPIQT